MLVDGQGFPKWRLSELERSVNNSIFPVAGRQLMADQRPSVLKGAIDPEAPFGLRTNEWLLLEV